jgi:phosphate transport system substrate-binding protein
MFGRVVSTVIFVLALAAPAHADTLVTGAGATFPYPLYVRWFREFSQIRPELRFNYQPLGSSGGVRQLAAGTLDFGASDVPLSNDELRELPEAVQLPVVIGAIAIVYSGVPDGLKLDGVTLAEIFAGRITRWDDPRIVALNPGLALPSMPIVVVHRADGSGSTLLFASWLGRASSRWHDEIGAGKSLRWPVGVGGRGNDAVAALVKTLPGAIGYVELAFARQTRLPVAAITASDGSFVRPTPEAVAAQGRGLAPPGVEAQPVSGGYPLSAYSYVILGRHTLSGDKGRALLAFLWWAIHDGQKLAAGLDYAPLPAATVAFGENLLRGIGHE